MSWRTSCWRRRCWIVSRHNARLEISQRSRAYRVPQAATSTFLEGMVVLPVPLGDTALVKVPHLFVQAHVQQEGTRSTPRPPVRRHRTALPVPLGDTALVKVPHLFVQAHVHQEGTRSTPRPPVRRHRTALPVPLGDTGLVIVPHLFVQAHVQQEGTH
jgi:hypothetical protein